MGGKIVLWVNHVRPTDSSGYCTILLGKLIKAEYSQIYMFSTDGRCNLPPHVDNKWFFEDETLKENLNLSASDVLITVIT